MKMGYETNMRIVKVMGNKPVTATVGDKFCHFRSTFEYNWSLYCEFRKEQGLIKDWTFEQTTFKFAGETFGPVRYLIDFDILNNDGTFHYEECKGRLVGRDNTKFRRVAKYRPEIVIDLIMQRLPRKNKSKGANRRRIAEKYVRRIVDASVIFSQLRGVINFK